MSRDVEDAAAALEAKIRDYSVIRAHRQAAIQLLDVSIAQFREELEALRGSSSGSPAPPAKQEAGHGLVRRHVLETIGTSEDGARAVEIEAALMERFGAGMNKRSHYVILSRLEGEGMVMKQRGRYWLLDAGAAELVDLKWGRAAGARS